MQVKEQYPTISKIAVIILFPTSIYLHLVFKTDLEKLENEEWRVAMNIPMHWPQSINITRKKRDCTKRLALC
jgi:hypothetical protein